LLQERLVGFVVLAHARARREFDWEDIDLLRTAGSQVAGTLVQASDARRLAEARQFEGFNRLTAFLMHDLKNIAAQQSLLLQNAERHKGNPAFIDDMLATVANSVQRIGRLLEQLRGGAAPAAQGRVQLAAVIARAIGECRAQPPMPAFEPPADELWVRADADQLATVLGHVIRNAQDAAMAHGHVTLTLKRESGQAEIEIEDDGAGMDEDFIRNRLFKPFFTTKASRGMGIGAYQAREYVRSLGGSMHVDSSPGEGSVFTIRLPLAEPAGDAAAADTLRAAS
jgi:putative PEP-CTERM system histidine kinase